MATRTMNNPENLLTVFQWLGITIVGFFTSTVPDYSENLIQVFWTVVSMSLGGIVSFYVKRFLIKRQERKDAKDKLTKNQSS